MRYSMAEWCTAPIETDVTLFYNSDFNKFVDEDRNIIYDLHELLDPWQIEEIKKIGMTEGYCITTSKDKKVIEIFFPDDWYELVNWNTWMHANEHMDSVMTKWDCLTMEGDSE